MNLTSLVRNLESQLKQAEKFTRQYDSHAETLRKKLAGVADVIGERLGIAEAATKRSAKKMSRAGRAAVAAAQRKRWAAVKAIRTGAKAVKATGKRKMSLAHRRVIVAAQKKRWAKFHAAKT